MEEDKNKDKSKWNEVQENLSKDHNRGFWSRLFNK